MGFQVQVESISPDRTQMYFRGNRGLAADYWDLEITTDRRCRTWYTVRHDGWVVLEMTAREVRTNESGAIATECFVTWKASETVPAEIMSHLPKPVKI